MIATFIQGKLKAGTEVDLFGTLRFSSRLDDRGYIFSTRNMVVVSARLKKADSFEVIKADTEDTALHHLIIADHAYKFATDERKVKTSLSTAELNSNLLKLLNANLDNDKQLKSLPSKIQQVKTQNDDQIQRANKRKRHIDVSVLEEYLDNPVGSSSG